MDARRFWDGIAQWFGYDFWNWGSAADWVTGLLTGGAVLLAVATFASERRRERQSQADRIVVRLRPQEDGTIKAIIRNYSDSDISDVNLVVRSLGDVKFLSILYLTLVRVLRDGGILAVSLTSLLPPKLTKATVVQEDPFSEIPPGKAETVVINLSRPRRHAFIAHLTFTDFRGTVWTRDLIRKKYVRDPEFLYYLTQ
ncbi:hypothetical protein [Rathayibacter sp. AY1C5]|uniref:hypothetical protein n=1 Tax=Rathayibacter sp. AY1C5 TaxID=2080538 RepID=UPI0011B004AB|nr:hypothetical protein [Rathayibacter sp. AY1C5]